MRILIWSLFIRLNERSMGCEGMYRYIISSGVGGFLDVLNISSYGVKLLDVDILVIFP